jgi:rfaE bifunctional protein nucleotidyltransferase chain/domain
VLIFGNGGSAADAQHMAAELVGRFLLPRRRALPAVALTTDSSVLTAVANDFGFEQVFARQVEALGRRGDVALAISTSGESENVLEGVRVARARGLRTIAIVGPDPSSLSDLVDLPVVVRNAHGPRVQETQLAVEHALCAAIEVALFASDSSATTARADPPTKIASHEKLLEQRQEWRRIGLSVVWTNGCFDLLHVGHVRSLAAARALGDVLVVGINGDDSVRRLKGPGRPLVPAAQRAEIVAGLESVDHVVVFDEPTPEAVLATLQPDIHAKGADYDEKPMPERDVVEAYGGRVELLPFVPGVSTSNLIDRLR